MLALSSGSAHRRCARAMTDACTCVSWTFSKACWEAENALPTTCQLLSLFISPLSAPAPQFRPFYCLKWVLCRTFSRQSLSRISIFTRGPTPDRSYCSQTDWRDWSSRTSDSWDAQMHPETPSTQRSGPSTASISALPRTVLAKNLPATHELKSTPWWMS